MENIFFCSFTIFCFVQSYPVYPELCYVIKSSSPSTHILKIWKLEETPLWSVLYSFISSIYPIQLMITNPPFNKINCISYFISALQSQSSQRWWLQSVFTTTASFIEDVLLPKSIVIISGCATAKYISFTFTSQTKNMTQI